MSWHKFPISLSELCIDTTLRCGQSFRWKKSVEGEVYSCAFNGRLISLRQDRTHLHYKVIQGQSASIPLTPRSENGNESKSRGETEDSGYAETFLRHYLNLEPNLGALYEQWSNADKNFKKKAPKFTGVRILRQDAWEALVGFICSSNNNISRISSMMDKLCIHYGSLVGHVDDQAFYDMPPPAALTSPRVEGHLRELGFGYRAKYLYQTALMISQEPEDWLDSLRNPESPVIGQEATDAGEMQPGGREGYRHAHDQLLALQGVGPKVADCVCLMGLGWGESVPVDTHVWQIAQRDYKFGKGKHRSLTKATYDAVADHFRQLWGKEAGWAHSVLFTADLRAFSERLTAKIEVDETIKAEDTPNGESSARVKLEVAPALPVKRESSEAESQVKEESSNQQSLVKSEEEVLLRRGVNSSQTPARSSRTTLSHRANVKLESEDVEATIESIEASVKEEHTSPVKSEPLTPRRIKSERVSHSARPGSIRPKKEEESPLRIPKQERESVGNAIGHLFKEEVESMLGVKRESAEAVEETRSLEDRQQPTRRASKRQKKR